MDRSPLLPLGLAILFIAQSASAQLAPLGSNLIVNGDAEADVGGLGGGAAANDVAISGWIESGSMTVIQYQDVGGWPTALDPGSPTRADNFFAGGTAAESSIKQLLDVSEHADEIDSGSIAYDLSGWLGGFQGQNDAAEVAASFRNGNGRILALGAIGPALASARAAEIGAGQTGFVFRTTSGVLPHGTRVIEITLAADRSLGLSNDGYADDLSFVLRRTSLLDVNLVINGGAEADLGGLGADAAASNLNITGWVDHGAMTVIEYQEDGGWPTADDPGTPTRGRNFFAGGIAADSSISQVIDISRVAEGIDAGEIHYDLSAWLGGFTDQDDSAGITAVFRDEHGLAVGTVFIDPVRREHRIAELGGAMTGLVFRSENGLVPAGARTVEIELRATRFQGMSNDAFADDIAFVLSRDTGGGICDPRPELERHLDFEIDGAGAALVPGQIIDHEFSGLGIRVTTHDPHRHPAMIFDSAAPSGGDHDLGTPNEDFGGPGIGSGGEAGRPNQNAHALGNVLIISEDGDSSDPDDSGNGGVLIIEFDHEIELVSVDLLDIDRDEFPAELRSFDADGASVGEAWSLTPGDNSVHNVPLSARGVRRLEIQLLGSGAVTSIAYCQPSCDRLEARDQFGEPSFDNDDGSVPWSGAWVEDDVAGLGAMRGNAMVWDGVLSLQDRPDTGTQPGVSRSLDIPEEVAAATFSFDYFAGNSIDRNDAVTVDVSRDGVNFETLEVFTGISGFEGGTRSFDITPFISPETTVRFRVTNTYGGSDELFTVDNVRIGLSCEAN